MLFKSFAVNSWTDVTPPHHTLKTSIFALHPLSTHFFKVEKKTEGSGLLLLYLYESFSLSLREKMVVPVSGYVFFSYLQVKAGALRHKSESHHRRDTRECTHHHKHSPAVELVGWAHAEAPACEKEAVTQKQSEVMQWCYRWPCARKRNAQSMWTCF